MSTVGNPYSGAFYDEIGPLAARSAARVVPVVMDLVAPTAVVDVGCGTGAWLAAFASAGVAEVVGVDGPHVDSRQLQIGADHFVAADLTDPPALGRTFDLAVSLEVAEHLPPAAADRFVAYLCTLAPVVLFSAAVPGQGGVDHVNEQWPPYWAARFADHGRIPVDVVRPVVWDDPEVAWYYAQNTLLYAPAERAEAWAATARLATPDGDAGARPLSLVHPRMLAAHEAMAAERAAHRPPASLSSLVRQLPGAAARAARRRAARRTDR